MIDVLHAMPALCRLLLKESYNCKRIQQFASGAFQERMFFTFGVSPQVEGKKNIIITVTPDLRHFNIYNWEKDGVDLGTAVPIVIWGLSGTFQKLV